MYRIFTRNWWKENKNWPDNREPHAGKKTHIKYVETEEEAREFCGEQNSHRLSSWFRLSRKYEYERT